MQVSSLCCSSLHRRTSASDYNGNGNEAYSAPRCDTAYVVQWEREWVTHYCHDEFTEKTIPQISTELGEMLSTEKTIMICAKLLQRRRYVQLMLMLYPISYSHTHTHIYIYIYIYLPISKTATNSQRKRTVNNRQIISYHTPFSYPLIQ